MAIEKIDIEKVYPDNEYPYDLVIHTKDKKTFLISKEDIEKIKKVSL